MEAFGIDNNLTIRTGAPVILSPASENFSPEDMIYKYKVLPCKCTEDHNHAVCPYAHPLEKARRRDVRAIAYIDAACPDFRKGTCKRGELCPFAHGVFEAWLHPARYRTQACRDGAACGRPICFFAHSLAELREPEPVEPPPLVSETLAAKRAAKAAATAAGAAGQLHYHHHHHHPHGLAGAARYKGGCCGSLSPSGPLSPTSSLTSLQEGQAGGGGLGGPHGLGCYPLGLRVASSPRPVASRPLSGRSMRFPSPGVSDLWRSDSAASLASLQSTALDSFPGTPLWSPVGPAPQGLGPAAHHALANLDCAALAQLLGDGAALHSTFGGVPSLGPSHAGLSGRDARMAAGFNAYPARDTTSAGIGRQSSADMGQHDFSSPRMPPPLHEAPRRHNVGAHGFGEPTLFGPHAGTQATPGLAPPAWSMQGAGLAGAWPLGLAA